jgi:hypothetical protein
MEIKMKRLALAAIAAGILASPAAADCAKDYKDFWDKINSQASAKMSGEQYSKLSRTALRGFDACSAGDQKFDSANFYEKLGQAAHAIPNDFWEKLGQQGQSK